MPRARRQLVDINATPFYHLISRCVRRAYLCGEDRASGKNFDHRRLWLVERMKELADIFAIDICAYAVMSNHFHLVVRVDRSAAQGWSEQEVVKRWGRLFPRRVEEIEGLSQRQQARLIALWRKRLWDLSWYMRCLNEAIARRANREDGCTGRFWEGRFRSQALLDEGAVLTCMSYVDLNPIRAGVANTLEASWLTSIRERLLARAGEEEQRSGQAPLVPFMDQPRHKPGRQAEALPLRLEEYVALLEEVGRLVRSEEPGQALGAQSAALLQQKGLDVQGFVPSIRSYSRVFFTMVGSVQRIDTEAKRRGYRHCRGRRAASELYYQHAA